MSILNQEDYGFKRLRWFFYRYLTWRDRLSVLIASKVLAPDSIPPNPTQATASETEVAALQAAQNRGASSLRSFWDLVMAYVPHDRREPNPFVVENT